MISQPMQPLSFSPALSPRPLFLLLLVASAPLQAIAAPSTTTTTSTSTRKSGQFVLSQAQQPVEPQSWSLRGVFPQVAWLRDTAVEKVFGLPPKAARPGADKSSRPSAQLPGNLLARYGGDVVLRFNISTPLEEEKLAEAADTLFLDVWEFTSNWADIRLSQDDVCSVPPHIAETASHSSTRYQRSLGYFQILYKRHTQTSCPTWQSPSTRHIPQPPSPSPHFPQAMLQPLRPRCRPPRELTIYSSAITNPFRLSYPGCV